MNWIPVEKETNPAGENESDSGFEMVNHSSFDNFNANNGIDETNGNYNILVITVDPSYYIKCPSSRIIIII